MRIATFQSCDLEELVEVWNRNLPADPISAGTLEARVLLDPNFREEFALMARSEDRIVGFVLGICGEGFQFSAERVPPERTGTRAWMLSMAVESEHRGTGIGSALLGELEQRFWEAGRRDVWIASYPTAYIVPGVDERAYAKGLAFLQKRGYQIAYTALAMDASLWPLELPEGVSQREQRLAAQGISFYTYSSRWLSAFRQFLRSHVPWDWEWLALRNLARIQEGSFRPEQFLLAVHEDKVIGYCQYEGGHFGPFEVAKSFQGRGIGTVLLARVLCSMAQGGLHNAWVLWTGDQAARLYARFGFRKSRSFAVLHKEI